MTTIGARYLSGPELRLSWYLVDDDLCGIRLRQDHMHSGLSRRANYNR